MEVTRGKYWVFGVPENIHDCRAHYEMRGMFEKRRWPCALTSVEQVCPPPHT